MFALFVKLFSDLEDVLLLASVELGDCVVVVAVNVSVADDVVAGLVNAILMSIVLP